MRKHPPKLHCEELRTSRPASDMSEPMSRATARARARANGARSAARTASRVRHGHDCAPGLPEMPADTCRCIQRSSVQMVADALENVIVQRTALGQSPELAARICAARSGRAATRMARIPLNATPLPTNESAGHPCQFTMSARWRRYGARAQAFRVHRRRDPCRSGGANKPNSLLINPQSVRREQKVGALGATQAASRRARCARDRR